MQNPHTKWRIDYAQQLAERLVAFKGIRGIVIAGSVARGFADAYSDIEIVLFWESLPDDVVRCQIVKTLGGTFLYNYDWSAQEDQLLIKGVQVDLWHIAVAHEEQILESVLINHQFDLGSLNALDTIRSCIPLVGYELVQKWKLRAQEYPDQLAENVIKKHLASFSIGELFIHAQRNNCLTYHAQLSFLQQEAFLVLSALNRMYFPTFKWVYRVLDSMPIKPKDIESRFQNAYEAPDMEAIQDTKSILEEITRLALEQFPQIDTSLTLRRLSYVRTAHYARQ